MSNGAPVKAPVVQASRLESVCLATATDSMLRDWKAFEADGTRESPMQDPEWLRGYFFEELDKITSYLLYDQSGAICGNASFLLKDWPIKLYLGELTLAELPLRRLRFLGGSPSLPEDGSLYDLLFRRLVNTTGCDALYFSQVPVESFLCRYLKTSPLVRNSFYCYKAADESPHLLLRFCASFEEYMKTNFSSTHRYTLRRKVSRIHQEAPGPVRLIRYTRPDEVTAFLDAAVSISRKTYQWNLHQRGLRATERFERRYRYAAERGWFRSYLLFCGDTPCAFLSGYQWKGRYDIDELGFDPAFTRHSPGTVLHMLAIQDMFSYDKPDVIDFGSYDKYKEEWATESYVHCDMMLLRRGAYCRLVQAAHHTCRFATKTAVRVLGALNLKSRLKKIVRSRSVSAAGIPPAGGNQPR